MSQADRKLSILQRRTLLKGLMVGGASLLPLAGHALRTPPRGVEGPRGDEPREPAEPAAATRPVGSSDDGRPPWHLVAPVRAGSYVGSGWHVEALSRVEQGAVVMTLGHLTGERAEVHVCRRNGLGRGLAQTAQLDFFLMNDADGDRRTPEGIGRAVKTVALRVARAERAELALRTAPRGMMSHDARVRWYGVPGSAA